MRIPDTSTKIGNISKAGPCIKSIRITNASRLSPIVTGVHSVAPTEVMGTISSSPSSPMIHSARFWPPTHTTRGLMRSYGRKKQIPLCHVQSSADARSRNSVKTKPTSVLQIGSADTQLSISLQRRTTRCLAEQCGFTS